MVKSLGSMYEVRDLNFNATDVSKKVNGATKHLIYGEHGSLLT